MAATERNKNSLEVYLRQYEQCWEDKRALEAMIWQTPAVFLAIVAVLLAGLISQGFPTLGGCGSARLAKLIVYSGALLLAFVASLVGTIQLSKHRMFCKARVDDLRMIESSLRTMARVHLVQFRTDQIMEDKRYPDIKGNRIENWINRRRAYNWLFALSIGVELPLLVGFVAWAIAAYLNWV